MRIYDYEVANAIAEQNGQILDFSETFANQRNVILHDGGIAFCIWSAPRVFECHLLFPPNCRGKQAVAASRRMGDYMMTYHADMLWGQPPANDRAAIWHIRQAGFTFYGKATNAIVGPVEFYVRRKICHL